MMRYITILLVFISFRLLSASDLDTLMQSANQLYQDKLYEEAIEKYGEILEQGFASTSLYYNLGNAYFRSGQLGFSILNYERGLKLDPDNSDLLYNLKIVKARTVDRIKEVPQIFIIEWWVSFITLFTAFAWQIVLIVFYLILIVSITLFFITKSGKVQRYTLYSAVVGLIGVVLFSIILFANIRRETSKDFAIITKNTVAAKQSPDESSNDLFVIHEGLKVAIVNEFGEWVEIELFDGNVGWLPKSTLESI